MSTLLLNSLFLQPVSSCSSSCHGCYLKKYKGIQKGVDTHIALLKEIFKENSILRPKQITISINSFKKESDPQFIFFQKMVNLIANSPFNNKFLEIHLTFNNTEQYSKYAFFMRNKNSYSKKQWAIFRKKISVFSISNINLRNKHEIVKLQGIKDKLNWNWIPQAQFSEKQENIKLIEETLRYVKNCYLIFMKNPLGEKQNEQTLARYITYYLFLKENLPPELFNKITLDNCIKCSIDFKNTGFGCSSNISEFHIWPNGRVTGCPYNSNYSGNKVLKDPIKIIKSIQNGRNSYDFDKCTLPETYNKSKKILIDFYNEKKYSSIDGDKNE